MKAPDKIYINKYMLRRGMLYPAQKPADEPEFEYIRKDALLEKLMDEIDKQINFYKNSFGGDSYCKGCNAGALAVLQWFKDKIDKVV